MGNNLKKLRMKAGYSQPVLAKMMGTTKNQLIKLEKGDRQLSLDWIEKAADALGVDAGDLVSDSDARDVVSAVGYVGAGAVVHTIDDYEKGAGLESIELDFPVKHGTVAVIVRGDSMLPIFEDGDVIGYIQEGSDPSSLIGDLCVVKVVDGPTYIKKLKRGSARGLFTLVSSNASDIEDVAIEWAARYQFHLPRHAWRKRLR